MNYQDFIKNKIAIAKIGGFEVADSEIPSVLKPHQRDIADLIFVGKLMSAQSFAESDWRLDGLPCGVLEHKNDQGEWVK